MGVLLSAGLLLAGSRPASAWKASSLFLHTNMRATAPWGGCSPPNVNSRALARVSLVNNRAIPGSLCRASRDGARLRLQTNVASGRRVAYRFYIRRAPCWYAMERANCEGMVLGTFSPQAPNAREAFELNDARARHRSTAASGGPSTARSGGSSARRSGVPCRCEPRPLGGLCLDELPGSPSACRVRECAQGYRCDDAGRFNCQRIQKPSYLRCAGGRSGNRCNDCRRVVKSFEVVQFLSA